MCLLTPVALARFSLKNVGGADFGNGSVSWSRRGKPQRFAPPMAQRGYHHAWAVTFSPYMEQGPVPRGDCSQWGQTALKYAVRRGATTSRAVRWTHLGAWLVSQRINKVYVYKSQP